MRYYVVMGRKRVEITREEDKEKTLGDRSNLLSNHRKKKFNGN